MDSKNDYNRGVPYGANRGVADRFLELFKKNGFKYTLMTTLTYPLMPWNIFIRKYVGFPARRLIRKNTVMVNNVPVKMGPFENERAVEIPLAMNFLKKYSSHDIIEVGNVLRHYGVFKHIVVDKYEKMGGVINEDILTFVPKKKYECVVSISTIEHIGFDEIPRDAEKIGKVLRRLYSIFLNEDGKMFLTFPLGYNPAIDRLIREHKFQCQRLTVFKHIKPFNQWEIVSELPMDAHWIPERHFIEYFCLWEVTKRGSSWTDQKP